MTATMTTYDLVRREASARTAEVTNALVAQKDAFRADVRRVEDAEALEAVYARLAFVAPLWEALGFGYKKAEVLRWMRAKALDMVRDNEEFLKGERKNSRARAGTMAEVRKLLNLAHRLGQEGG